MPELTYILAVLVRKDLLSIQEASQLLKASKEGTVNANLGEMITKVDKALKKKTDDMEKISATDFLKDK